MPVVEIKYQKIRQNYPNTTKKNLLKISFPSKFLSVAEEKDVLGVLTAAVNLIRRGNQGYKVRGHGAPLQPQH